MGPLVSSPNPQWLAAVIDAFHLIETDAGMDGTRYYVRRGGQGDGLYITAQYQGEYGININLDWDWDVWMGGGPSWGYAEFEVAWRGGAPKTLRVPSPPSPSDIALAPFVEFNRLSGGRLQRWLTSAAKTSTDPVLHEWKRAFEAARIE